MLSYVISGFVYFLSVAQARWCVSALKYVAVPLCYKVPMEELMKS